MEPEEPTPGAEHLYLTEFSGTVIYAHEPSPLDQPRIHREVPEAVREIMEMIRRTTGYTPYQS